MENQKKLFELEPIRVRRPDINTFGGGEAYLEIAKEIIEWDNSNNKPEDLAEDLEYDISIRDLMQDNGYELCKTLEDMGYSPDGELVSIMDSAHRHVRNEFLKCEKKWVTDCWIKPAFEIGDKMQVKYRNKQYEGKIVDIKNEEAKYMFFIPEVMSEGSQLYVKFEDVESDFFKTK